MRKYRFHLLGLAHLPTNKHYLSCAFTQKNVKLARMLMSLGHEVYLYGVKSQYDPQPICTEFIETHSLSDIRNDYGDGDNRFEIGYDWTNTDFRHDFNKSRVPSTIKFYDNCIKEINRRKKHDDFLLCTQGHYQMPISNGVNLYLSCEPGIGYRGSCLNFRAFESAYIQNFTYGSEHPRECINGSYYDRVIPNYFDAEDFEVSTEKDDYYLFIGRMIKRKGIVTAALACNALKKKLIIVGQGAAVDANGHLQAISNTDFNLAPGTWEYLGYADLEKRKKLMARAIATFTPTEYLECFAGTHVESTLSATPVITTDFAVFTGTVINGLNGYRCSTLDDFVWAGKQCAEWTADQRMACRKHAERYLSDNVKLDYQRWFDDLYDVYESTVSDKKGWHRVREEEPFWRKQITW